MLVCAAGNAASQHKSAVWNPRVAGLQFFLRNKMHGGIVIGKIIGHRFNIALHARRVGPFFQHHKTFPRMLLAYGQNGVFAGAHRV